MRIGLMAVGVMLALGGFSLAGCEQKAEKAETPPQGAQVYNLSAESNREFLANNAAKPGVITTASGLQYRVIKSGTGKSPQSGADLVTVTYRGTLITGQLFDETAAGKTAQFLAGQLIPGWVEALPLMKEGDTWELVVPADLGYGAEGAGDGIPPNQTLVYQLTLVKVDAAQK